MVVYLMKLQRLLFLINFVEIEEECREEECREDEDLIVRKSAKARTTILWKLSTPLRREKNQKAAPEHGEVCRDISTM